MTAQRLITLFAICFILVLVQLLAALAHPLLGIIAGLAVGGLSIVLLRAFAIEEIPAPALALGAFLSSAIGIALPLLSQHTSRKSSLLVAPVLAAGITFLSRVVSDDKFGRCGLCHRRLTSTAFDCPRCGLVVCEQSCWSFHDCRCTQCEKQKVPILSTDRSWWDTHLGPRIWQGRCQRCQTGAEEADLRTCVRCGRRYCRKCWDRANGQCSHCLWTIPALPERLKKYVVRFDTQTRSSRAGRTNPGSTRGGK